MSVFQIFEKIQQKTHKKIIYWARIISLTPFASASKAGKESFPEEILIKDLGIYFGFKK